MPFPIAAFGCTSLYPTPFTLSRSLHSSLTMGRGSSSKNKSTVAARPRRTRNTSKAEACGTLNDLVGEPALPKNKRVKPFYVQENIEEGVECFGCNQRFFDLVVRDEHFKVCIKPNDKGLYECFYKKSGCSYTNKENRNLRRHFRGHIKHQRFACEGCHRRFCDESNWTHHQQQCKGLITSESGKSRKAIHNLSASQPDNFLRVAGSTFSSSSSSASTSPSLSFSSSSDTSPLPSPNFSSTIASASNPWISFSSSSSYAPTLPPYASAGASSDMGFIPATVNPSALTDPSANFVHPSACFGDGPADYTPPDRSRAYNPYTPLFTMPAMVPWAPQLDPALLGPYEGLNMVTMETLARSPSSSQSGGASALAPCGASAQDLAYFAGCQDVASCDQFNYGYQAQKDSRGIEAEFQGSFLEMLNLEEF
ncbi:hypothetical protein HGRIS_005130 [Hohenbuehelia grisea]|uniref:Uncharacterized protein n=1 Tax=Hohenbuehelia grisea TaxID=104357 RepID=A0ABR3JES1_9AGAR